MRRHLILLAAFPILLVACESSTPVETDPGDTVPVGTAAPAALGHCVYTNKFSQMEECREYEGSAWTESAVAEDCTEQDGKLSDGVCSYDKTLGTCVLDKVKDKTTLVIAVGDDPSKCAGMKMGCETFAGGTFEPSDICKGETPPDPNATVFHPPKRICKDPLPGEPPGLSENGQVCTWEMISGCTEPGRKFVDYVSCEPVYTQRPYYPVGPANPPSADARMNDPAYVAELDWVKSQVESAACVCCHQKSVTPGGAAVWDIEAEGNWMDSFSEYGLAFAGGFIPSWPLGAYPKEENNGFIRDMPDAHATGLPSTDPDRMAAFFKAELEHRGKTVDEYKGSLPTPEFFYEQAIYQPTACEAGVGVDAAGAVTWKGGDARYVYVLEAGSKNPGTPPNLDLPTGTVWKVDVRPDQTPVKSGAVTFGEVPGGADQAFPKGGAPPALTPGKTYYLVTLTDVGIPSTRCLFDYTGK